MAGHSAGKGLSTAIVSVAIVAVVILVVPVTIYLWRGQVQPSSGNTQGVDASRDKVATLGSLGVKPVPSETSPEAPHESTSPENAGKNKTAKTPENPAPLVIETNTLGLAGLSGSSVLGLVSLKSGGPVSRLEFFCSPLKAEGDAPPQPAATVVAKPETSVLASESQRDVLLDFTLPIVPPGKYTSRLFVRYNAATSQGVSVPIALTIKHNWHWPLLVLFLGVLAGAVVSNYRSVGRPRDEVYQRLGKLRSEIHSDDKLAAEFRSYIEQNFLSEAELYVRNGQTEQAGPRLDQAQIVWVRWLRNRDEWVELLAFLSDRQEVVNKMRATARTTRTCRDKLDTLRHQVPTMDNPEPLRTGLTQVRILLEDFRDLDATVTQQEVILDQCPGDQKADWQVYVDKLREGIDALDIGNDSAVSEFKRLIKDGKPKGAARMAAAMAASMMERSFGSPPTPPVPAARQGITRSGAEETDTYLSKLRKRLENALSPEYAGLRLTIFYCFAWLAVMFVLVWTGMEQLYASKPTFGSGSDYFTLFGWGFGSNASSSTIVQAFNGTPKSAPASVGRPG